MGNLLKMKQKSKSQMILESHRYNKKDNMLELKIKNDPIIYHLAIEEIPKTIEALENDEI